MILGLVRGGLVKAVQLSGKRLNFVPAASVSSKTKRGGPIQRPKPWDYNNKRYDLLQGFYDKTSWRFDENTKVIVVDGPIASGKTAFAKALAAELELFHLPEVTLDSAYINDYGFDLRQLDPQIPESCRSYDVRNFHQNPTDKRAASFQIMMFRERVMQYQDALCHLMNTGQGVVLERSWISDYAFLEAMFECGWISPEAKKYYYLLKENVTPLLLRPHLAIYLDVPVPIVQDRIKKRSISYEVNSKALTPKFLASIEKNYKELYLKYITIHSELLVYDWSEGGDAEIVIEDIEKIDFEQYTWNDKRLRDWKFQKEWDLCEERITYTSDRELLRNLMNHIPPIGCPEVWVSSDDNKIRMEVYDTAPGQKYDFGFNRDQGDTGLIFKSKTRYRPPIKHY